MDYSPPPYIMIGVTGASGSGKTHLLKTLSKYLGYSNITHLDLDGFHIHTRQERQLLGICPEDINANDFNGILHAIKTLKVGSKISVPTYDHKTGTFCHINQLEPKPIILVEGLHAALVNEISNENLLDTTLFMNPDEDLRKGWKVQRDIHERNYTYKLVTEEIDRREEFVKKYITPQSASADILINMTKNGGVKCAVLCSNTFISKQVHLSSGFFYKYITLKKAQGEYPDRISIAPRGSDKLLRDLKNSLVSGGKLTPPVTIPLNRDDSYIAVIRTILAVILISIMSKRDT